MRRALKLMVFALLVVGLLLADIVPAAALHQIHSEVFHGWFVPKVGHKTIMVIKEYYEHGIFLHSTTTYSYSGDGNYAAYPYYTDGDRIIFHYDSGILRSSMDTQDGIILSSGGMLTGIFAAPGKSIFKRVTSAGMTSLVSKHPYRANLWDNISITSYYGPRIHPITGEPDFHNGIDYGTKTNTYAITASTKTGKVTFPSEHPSYGLYGNIDTTYDGVSYRLRYAHMSYRDMSLHNTNVIADKVIGNTGTTGASTGIHLHLEVFRKGSRIDPETVFYKFHEIGDMYR